MVRLPMIRTITRSPRLLGKGFLSSTPRLLGGGGHGHGGHGDHGHGGHGGHGHGHDGHGDAVHGHHFNHNTASRFRNPDHFKSDWGLYIAGHPFYTALCIVVVLWRISFEFEEWYLLKTGRLVSPYNTSHAWPMSSIAMVLHHREQRHQYKQALVSAGIQNWNTDLPAYSG